MAAVLCSLPCTLCSQTCKFCSSSFGCCCGGCVKGLKRVCRSPFCVFGTVATILNVPPIITTVSMLPEALSLGGTDCQGMLWMVINSGLAAVNLAAAWYFAGVITRREKKNKPIKDWPDTAFERATFMLCYDPWIAIYMCFALGFMIWQAMGSAWIAFDLDGGENCPHHMMGAWSAALSFGWTYIFVGAIALLLGFCCASCDKTNYNENGPKQFYVTPEQRARGHIPSVEEDTPEMVKKGAAAAEGGQAPKSKFAKMFGKKEKKEQSEADIPMADAVIVEDPVVVQSRPPSTAPRGTASPLVAVATTAVVTGASAPNEKDLESGRKVKNASGATATEAGDPMSTISKVVGGASKSVMKQVQKMKPAQVN